MKIFKKFSTAIFLAGFLVFTVHYVSSKTISQSNAETDAVEKKADESSLNKETRKEIVHTEKSRIKEKRVSFNFVEV